MSARVQSPANPAEAVNALFKRHFQHTPPCTVKVPGRVELLGARSDLDDGLSLCAAVDRHVFITAAPRTDGRIQFASSNADRTETFWMSELDPDAGAAWSAPLKSVLAELRKRRVNFSGFNAAIHSTIPIAADLGDCPARTLATALIVRRLYPFGLSETGATVPPRRNERGDLPPLTAPEKLNFARLCHDADRARGNNGARLADSLAALCGKAWHVISVDARVVTVERVPLIGEVLIVCPTGATPEPTSANDSSFAQQRALCESAARKLDAKSLRSVELNHLKANRAKLDAGEWLCAGHVVGETARVVAAERALREDDHAQFGQFIWQSHESARNLPGQESEEAELLVRLARRHSGCLGARAIRGATLNLVAYHQAESFMTDLKREFEALLGFKLSPLVCQIVDGAT